MNRFLALLPMLVLIFVSCETIVDIDLPEHRPQLVVNSYFGPDQDWSVHVTRSIGILEQGQPLPVFNAQVEVWDEGVRVAELEHVSAGYYRTSRHRPQPNRMYTLHVTAPGFDAIEAASTVPPGVEVTHAEEISSWKSQLFAREAQVKLLLDDPQGQKNFYQLEVVRVESVGSMETVFSIPFRLHDRSIIDNRFDDSILFEGERFQAHPVLFSDVLFDGKRFELSLSTVLYDNRSGPTASYYVLLSAVSEELFHYGRTMALQNSTVDNPFSEPVQVYTNVRNGLGIFAGLNTRRIRVGG